MCIRDSYWRSVDQSIGDRIEAQHKADAGAPNPGAEKDEAKAVGSNAIRETNTFAAK